MLLLLSSCSSFACVCVYLLNVAQPLTSFLTGVDFIAHSLEDCEEDIRNSNEGLSFIDTYIQPMQTCIDSIRNTNAFMTMTINR